MYTETEKQFIINLAKRSIEHYLAKNKLLKIGEGEVPESLKEKHSCFVTLNLARALRGCIGHLEPVQSLYLDIIENAAGAAFNDHRFAPLSAEEYPLVEIEVSVLAIPQELFFTSSQELLDKLRPIVDGVIIKKGKNSATYLPQVWEDLPNKEYFLNSLCQKAGLSADEWQKEGVRVWIYQVEEIK